MCYTILTLKTTCDSHHFYVCIILESTQFLPLFAFSRLHDDVPIILKRQVLFDEYGKSKVKAD